MYQEIKRLADEAIALQNKDRMDAVLRQISALCTPGAVMLIDGEYRTSVRPMDAGEFPFEAADLAEKVKAQLADAVLLTSSTKGLKKAAKK
jgi:hypothetical protein